MVAAAIPPERTLTVLSYAPSWPKALNCWRKKISVAARQTGRKQYTASLLPSKSRAYAA